jgi:hypothetical protein
MSTKGFGPYEFLLTDSEYGQARREAERRVRAFHGGALQRRAPLLLVVVATAAVVYGLALGDVFGIAQASAFSIAVIVALLVGQWLFAWQIRRLAHRTEAVTKTRAANWTVAVTPDGIRLETVEVGSQIRWLAIDDARPVGDLVFIWLRSLRYVAIPNRLFAQEADRTALVSYLRARIGTG